jgi:hypothetical protein
MAIEATLKGSRTEIAAPARHNMRFAHPSHGLKSAKRDANLRRNAAHKIPGEPAQ